MPGMFRKYIQVTKPGIVAGNMVSTAGGFFLASQGQIDYTLLAVLIIGLSLVVASGCVFNNYIDRDVDRKMTRTNNRVLARGLISSVAALVYASVLGIAGIFLLVAKTALLCSVITLAGFIIYTVVYSLYVKRRSIYGTLIGSLAGAAPPLAGYCAVTNSFDTGAWILLAIFVLWQVPHSYALVVQRFTDYKAAHIPAFPVKKGIPAAKKHIIGFILAFLLTAPMLTLVGYTGYMYLAAAGITGLAWLGMACYGLKTSDDRIWGKQLFTCSIITITVLNIMMSID